MKQKEIIQWNAVDGGTIAKKRKCNVTRSLCFSVTCLDYELHITYKLIKDYTKVTETSEESKNGYASKTKKAN